MRRLAAVLLVPFSGTAATAEAQQRRAVRDPAGGPPWTAEVRSGDVEQGELRVTARSGGRTRTARAGIAPGVTMADPLGDDPWRLARATAGDGGAACVRWERVRRFTRPARTVRARGRERCGPRDEPVGVAAADRVDGRLVVTGVAAGDVRSAVLRGQAGSTLLRRDPHTGAFLGVLAGDTDPASLRVVATLRGGRRVARALDVARR